MKSIFSISIKLILITICLMTKFQYFLQSLPRSYIHQVHIARKDITCTQLILVSIYTLHLELLLNYMVIFRWTTTTIVADLDGGPDLFIPGFLPWIIVVFNHTIYNWISAQSSHHGEQYCKQEFLNFHRNQRYNLLILMIPWRHLLIAKHSSCLLAASCLKS